MMSALSNHLSDYILPDQLDSYERDGFLHLKNIVSESELCLLRQAINKQKEQLAQTTTGYDFESLARQLWNDEEQIDAGDAQRFDLELYRHIIREDKTARPIRENTNQELGGKGLFLYEAAGWRKFSEIRSVAFDSIIPMICARLMDSSYINFWEDTTFVKGPRTPQKTVFHQDYTYFQIKGSKCCIAWIALDPATRETGAMQYIRGSHKWGKAFAPNVFIAQTPLLEAEHPKLPDIEAHPDKYDIVTVEADPGDIIIHNVMTVHGSGGNMSRDQTRRAISFRYCGDDIRYYERSGAIPQPYISNSLPDGAPLYSEHYPLVWPKPAPNIKLAPLFKDQPLVV